MRVEDSARFTLEQSTLFLNASDERGAAVDLRGCTRCRLTQNRILANHGVGLRLDVESHANEIERNVVLDQRPHDVVDAGSDNAFALNVFERGDGVTVPALAPLVGSGPRGLPLPIGCGSLNAPVAPRQTVILTCPQDSGLRAVRNSVVALSAAEPVRHPADLRGTCKPAETAAGDIGGRRGARPAPTPIRCGRRSSR